MNDGRQTDRQTRQDRKERQREREGGGDCNRRIHVMQIEQEWSVKVEQPRENARERETTATKEST